jgi:hypothetical protein
VEQSYGAVRAGLSVRLRTNAGCNAPLPATGLLRAHLCNGPPAHMFAGTPTGLCMSGSMNVRNPWIREQGCFWRPCSVANFNQKGFPMSSIIYIVGLVVVVVAVLSFFGLR